MTKACSHHGGVLTEVQIIRIGLVGVEVVCPVGPGPKHHKGTRDDHGKVQDGPQSHGVVDHDCANPRVVPFAVGRQTLDKQLSEFETTRRIPAIHGSIASHLAAPLGHRLSSSVDSLGEGISLLRGLGFLSELFALRLHV